MRGGDDTLGVIYVQLSFSAIPLCDDRRRAGAPLRLASSRIAGPPLSHFGSNMRFLVFRCHFGAVLSKGI